MKYRGDAPRHECIGVLHVRIKMVQCAQRWTRVQAPVPHSPTALMSADDSFEQLIAELAPADDDAFWQAADAAAPVATAAAATQPCAPNAATSADRINGAVLQQGFADSCAAHVATDLQDSDVGAASNGVSADVDAAALCDIEPQLVDAAAVAAPSTPPAIQIDALPRSATASQPRDAVAAASHCEPERMASDSATQCSRAASSTATPLQTLGPAVVMASNAGDKASAIAQRPQASGQSAHGHAHVLDAQCSDDDFDLSDERGQGELPRQIAAKPAPATGVERMPAHTLLCSSVCTDNDAAQDAAVSTAPVRRKRTLSTWRKPEEQVSFAPATRRLRLRVRSCIAATSDAPQLAPDTPAACGCALGRGKHLRLHLEKSPPSAAGSPDKADSVAREATANAHPAARCDAEAEAPPQQASLEPPRRKLRIRRRRAAAHLPQAPAASEAGATSASCGAAAKSSAVLDAAGSMSTDAARCKQQTSAAGRTVVQASGPTGGREASPGASAQCEHSDDTSATLSACDHAADERMQDDAQSRGDTCPAACTQARSPARADSSSKQDTEATVLSSSIGATDDHAASATKRATAVKTAAAGTDASAAAAAENNFVAATPAVTSTAAPSAARVATAAAPADAVTKDDAAIVAAGATQSAAPESGVKIAAAAAVCEIDVEPISAAPEPVNPFKRMRPSAASGSPQKAVGGRFGAAAAAGGGSARVKTVSGAAAFEAHSRGIGSKLLRSMGWQPGGGLGARGDGIATPLQPAMRRPLAGLGSEGAQAARRTAQRDFAGPAARAHGQRGAVVASSARRALFGSVGYSAPARTQSMAAAGKQSSTAAQPPAVAAQAPANASAIVQPQPSRMPPGLPQHAAGLDLSSSAMPPMQAPLQLSYAAQTSYAARAPVQAQPAVLVLQPDGSYAPLAAGAAVVLKGTLPESLADCMT